MQAVKAILIRIMNKNMLNLTSNHLQEKRAKKTNSSTSRTPISLKGDKEMRLESFRNKVDTFGENKMNFTFENAGIEHAGVVLCAMARYAESKFIVYDVNLEGDITKGTNVYDEIEKFLERGGKFEIVTKTNPKDNISKKKLFDLRDKYKDNVDLMYINEAEISKELISDCFTVVDDKGYRQEYNFSKRKAKFNFNNPTISKSLTNRFEQIKKYTSTM
ncbi:MAG: hypothetical protein IPJ79_18695 [Bacteroidetes bacterium]|nr:hypothetical protein [Bacteroidota bacterium]